LEIARKRMNKNSIVDFDIDDDSKIELREVDGKKMLSGYAVLWEKKSVPIYGIREKIRKGTFDETLNKKDDVAALWNHERSKPLGRLSNGTLRLKPDDIGLGFEIDIPETTWGRDAVVSIQRKDVRGMSFGMIPNKTEWDENDPKNVIRTITGAELLEISPCTFPAYPQTKVMARSVDEEYDDYTKEKIECESIIKHRLEVIKTKTKIFTEGVSV
jgi:hypothetical protein